MKHLLPLLLLLTPILLSAQSEKVTFSQSGGAYDNTFSLSLSCENASNQIRYTLNGNAPTANSARYQEPLRLGRDLFSNSDIYKIQTAPEQYFHRPDSVLKAIVIRAAVFDENGNQLSDVATNSYFINTLGCNFHELPVVSICADSLALFSYDTGIFVPGRYFDNNDWEWTGNYYQTGDDWERIINLEYYTPDNQGFNQVAGIRTHGGNGRHFDQKSVRLYARKEYGEKNFSFKIFDDLSISKFKRLVLKPFRSAWTDAGLQDCLASRIAQPLNVDRVASRPVVLFINGEYWGIYFIEEKSDERYLENHYDIDSDDANIVESWGGELNNGTNEYFLEFYHWMENADLTNETDYQYATNHIDLDNFIDYYIYELFTKNYDWPANNMRCWQIGDGPWRWFFYDADACFQNKENDIYGQATYQGDDDWPSSTTATLYFRQFLKNEDFKNKFLKRLLDLNSTVFQYSKTRPILKDLSNSIAPEISNQAHRFGMPVSEKDWRKHIDDIHRFLKERPEKFMQQTIEFFEMTEPSIFPTFTCYPNPSRSGDQISVRFDSETYGLDRLAIFDINGRCLYQTVFYYCEGTNEIPIDITLPGGTYVVRIGKTTQKMVVVSPASR
ncbi:MAG: CotH kinase family protein [Bacteroidales bacterium]|nr:CotH kinase family protein [Bacteroidales bacterium]